MPEALFHPKLKDYLDGLVPARHPELQKMEAYAAQHKFPIVGPACGQLCYQVARLIGARKVYELGSGYGYSTAWFARAVRENGGGTVHHVVWDQTLSDMAKKHLDVLGFSDIVKYTMGEAVGALRNTNDTFDLIFMDIDKDGYAAALPLIETRLRSGGILIVDNMLWHARIFDDNDRENTTEAIREITRLVSTSPHWTASIIPIRDGLLIATKT